MNRVYHPFSVFLYIFCKLSDTDRMLAVPPHLTGQHQVVYPTLKGGLTKHIRKYIFWWKTDENLNSIGLYETFGAAVRYCDTGIMDQLSGLICWFCQFNKKGNLTSLVLSDERLRSAFLQETRNLDFLFQQNLTRWIIQVADEKYFFSSLFEAMLSFFYYWDMDELDKMSQLQGKEINIKPSIPTMSDD